MPKGPKIADEVHQVIATKVLENPTMKREEIVHEIKKVLDARGGHVPERNTLLKQISFYRHHSPVSLDVPWSVGSLAQHPIPPEALPVVLQAYVLEDTWGTPTATSYGVRRGTLTVREALWVARIYQLFLDEEDGNQEENWRDMLQWARTYALKEQEWQAQGRRMFLHTSITDRDLMDAVRNKHSLSFLSSYLEGRGFGRPASDREKRGEEKTRKQSLHQGDHGQIKT